MSMLINCECGYVVRGQTEEELLTRAEPNAGHLALAELERGDLVQAIVTQNIDGLHGRAGSENVIEMHGSIRRTFPSRRKPRISSSPTRYSQLAEPVYHVQPPRPVCGGSL